MHQKPKLPSILVLLLLVISFPFLLIAIQTAQQLLSQATGTRAAISVDAQHTLEEIKPFWNSFAQGGEESTDMVAPIVGDTKLLSPRYIRIDHIFDHYDVVSRQNDGQLLFNFSKLDLMVQSILATGALPFFSLSYMPPVIAQNGDILNKPNNWNDWAIAVQKTIEHYSGTTGLNLANLYYEVWNEPDLFGKWRYFGDKNYLTLYSTAVMGANRAQNVNAFKIGGPATTQLYSSWITALVSYVNQNNLRLDFLSWHRYTSDPTQLSKDATAVTGWLFPYPKAVAIPRIISEWGFDSEINSGYDGNFAAAHTVATVRQAINGYEQLMAFELVDGPSPEGKEFWGRWGLLTHPSYGKHRKPRFTAFQLLNRLKGQRLLLSGEGTWVTGLAALNGQTISIILANYDQFGTHTEAVPVQITQLADRTYDLKITRLGQPVITQTVTAVDGTLTTEVIMTSNSVALLELMPPPNPFLAPL
jgi:hypothetical protein